MNSRERCNHRKTCNKLVIRWKPCDFIEKLWNLLGDNVVSDFPLFLFIDSRKFRNIANIVEDFRKLPNAFFVSSKQKTSILLKRFLSIFSVISRQCTKIADHRRLLPKIYEKLHNTCEIRRKMVGTNFEKKISSIFSIFLHWFAKIHDDWRLYAKIDEHCGIEEYC